MDVTVDRGPGDANAQPGGLGDFRYDAFISYSRRDKWFAGKLYKELSAFKPPSDLQVPQRHLRVFLDQSDFTGVDYETAIREHLGHSARLIVLCSPNARQSVYINEEIEVFARTRGAEHIIPVILAGIPNNEVTAGTESEQAFPAALCAAMTMPLARDFRGLDARGGLRRKPFDSQWYFVLADVYGKSRAEIERRDHNRRVRTQQRLLAIAGAVIVTLVALTVFALVQRGRAVTNEGIARTQEQEANVQRKAAEDNAALARKNEQTAEAQRAIAEEQRRTASDRLATLNLSNGNALRDADDVPGSMLWFVEAWRYATDPEVHRVRLASAMAAYPQLVGVWPLSTKREGELMPPRLIYVFHPDGRRIAIVDAARAVHIVDLASGRDTVGALAHRGAVHALDFSPDGRVLATASADGTVKVWDAGSGRSTATMPHGAPVMYLRFDARGTRLATATQNEVRVWDRATAKLLLPPVRATGRIEGLTFSPDGRWFIIDAGSGAQLFDAASGKQVTPPLWGPTVTRIAFTDAGHPIFLAGGSQGSRIVDAESGAVLVEFPQEYNPSEWLRFSADGRFAISLSGTHNVSVWDTASGKMLGEAVKYGPQPQYAEFTADGKQFYTIDYNFEVQVRDAETSQERRAPVKHRTRSTARFSKDGRRLVSATDIANTVQVHETGSGSDASPIMQMSDEVRETALSPTGRFLLTVDAVARIWDLDRSGYSELPCGGLRAAASDLEGRFLVFCSTEKGAQVWDAEKQKPVGRPLATDAEIESARFDPTGRRLIVESYKSISVRDGIRSVSLWDAATGARLSPDFAKVRMPAAAMIRDDGSQVLLQHDDGSLGVWDVAGKRYVAKLAVKGRHLYSGAFTTRGPCALLGAGTTVQLYNVETGMAVSPPLRHPMNVGVTAIRADCAQVATISADDNARLWDAASGQATVLPATDADLFKTYNDVSYCPEGTCVITQSNDEAIRLWNPETATAFTRQMRTSIDATDIVFSRDRKYLLAGEKEGVVRVWDAATGEQVAAIGQLPVVAQESIFAFRADRSSVFAAHSLYLRNIYTQATLTRSWDMTPLVMTLDQAAAYVRAMSGRQIDASGFVVSLSESDVLDAYKAASAAPPSPNP